MPGTVNEVCAWVRAVLAGQIMPDAVPLWEDGSRATAAEQREITALLCYEAIQRLEQSRRARAVGPPERRARQLLSSFLSPAQRRQWRQRGCFDADAASGARYRFQPGRARVSRLVLHGCRWYEETRFCLHQDPEEEERLPPGDVALSQLLLLLADELEFLATANATPIAPDQWDGEYRRRLTATRALRS